MLILLLLFHLENLLCDSAENGKMGKLREARVGWDDERSFYGIPESSVARESLQLKLIEDKHRLLILIHVHSQTLKLPAPFHICGENVYFHLSDIRVA